MVAFPFFSFFFSLFLAQMKEFITMRFVFHNNEPTGHGMCATWQAFATDIVQIRLIKLD
jgi:hypothetical protein